MGRRSRFVGWSAAALAAVLAACGGNGEDAVPATSAPPVTTATTRPLTTPAPPPTTPAPTVAPSSRVPSSTAATATTESTTPRDDGRPGFVPACVDRTAEGDALELLDLPADLERLGADPSLVIELPRFRDREGAEPSDAVANVTPVPGGVLVLVRQDPYDEGTLGWQVVFVDYDGGVRWRRCGAGEYVEMLGAPDDPTGRVLVWTYGVDGLPGVHALDVASGADVDARDVQRADGRPVAAGAGRVLLGRTDERRIDLATDRLTLLDVADGSSSEVPYPERAAGQEPFRLIWELVVARDGAGPVIVQRDPFGAAVGVYVDGAWRTDGASIADVVALSVRESYGEQPGIEALAADGSRRWFHPTEGGLPGEGFHWMVVADTVLANVCREAGGDSGCTTGEFVALDLATGDLRWSLPRFRAVGVAGERFVIVGDEWATSDAHPYRMLDLATGEALPGQQWPSHAFDHGCCGEMDFVFARTANGVVWAVRYGTVTLYLPETAAHPTLTVDLSR